MVLADDRCWPVCDLPECPRQVGYQGQSRLVLLTQSLAGVGRVEMWRGGCRLNISVAASFVWRCLSGSTMTPFPHPAHRTGHADRPHPALGQDLTPFALARRAQARSGVRARSAHNQPSPKRVVGSACASSNFEACSAFTRVAACTLALSPIRDTLISN